jgi:hypothetical protein
MNYDDLYEILKNASVATLSRFEQSGKAARAFVRRYHMWRFVVQREYPLQYLANYDENDQTHMRPQMKTFLDTVSKNRGDDQTYWKRFYEFLSTRLPTWLTKETLMKGFYVTLRSLKEKDNNDARPVESMSLYMPEVDELVPGTRIAAFALNYVGREREGKEEEEQEQEQNAFEVLVNEQGDGVVQGNTVKRQDAKDQSLVEFIVSFGSSHEALFAPDGRFKLALKLTPARLEIHAFFYKNIVTTEKLVSHSIQSSFWI